jgi:hypothetical protein
MHVMKINPAVEVYFLDLDGRVLAHALEGLLDTDPIGASVDLRPVRQLLARDEGDARDCRSRAPIRCHPGRTRSFPWLHC